MYTLNVSEGARPWVPDALQERVTARELAEHGSYVVVEEIVLDEIRTVASTWPMLDPVGQLLFGDPEDAAEYVDSRDGIERLLNDRRIVPVEELQDRPVEVGDVFAVLGPVGGGPGDGGGGRRRPTGRRPRRAG